MKAKYIIRKCLISSIIVFILIPSSKAQEGLTKFATKIVKDTIKGNELITPKLELFIESKFENEPVKIVQSNNVIFNKKVQTDNMTDYGTSFNIERILGPLQIIFRGEKVIIDDYHNYNYIRIRYFHNTLTVILTNRKPVFK